MPRTLLYWICQFTGWTAFFGGTAALALAGRAASGPPAGIALSVAGSVLLAIGATHAIRAVAVRRGWLERSIGPLALRLAGAVGVAALATEGLSTALGAVLEGAFGPAPATAVAPGTVLISGAALIAVVYGLWVVVYLSAVTRFRLADAERERLELRASLAEARLEAVERRLDPHVLFNALNAVRALVREDPEEARRAVTMLSDLLRATLSAQGPTHTVEAEVALVRAALGIEALRFAERLDARVVVADAALGAQVPVFLVQTLAENAVTHGIARRLAGGTVCVDVGLEGGAVVVRVENPTADTADTAGGSEPGTGTGLASTRERLALLYGPAATFSLTVEGGRAVALARFPAAPHLADA